MNHFNHHIARYSKQQLVIVGLVFGLFVFNYAVFQSKLEDVATNTRQATKDETDTRLLNLQQRVSQEVFSIRAALAEESGCDAIMAFQPLQTTKELRFEESLRSYALKSTLQAHTGKKSNRKFKKNPNLEVTAGIPRGSFSMFVHDLKECVFISKNIHDNGVFEPQKARRLSQVLGNALETGQKNFLDVGANIGFFSFLAASLGHKVVSVEPLDYNLELVNATREINWFQNRMEVFKTAVADKDKPGMCVVPAATDGSGVAPHNRGNGQIVPAEKYKSKCVEYIPVTTLDKVIPDREYYAVKIDTEGYEVLALRGATNLWKKPPCYLFAEHNPLLIKQIGVDPDDLFRDMEARGYAVYKEGSNEELKSVTTGTRTYGDDFEFRLKDPVRCPDVYVK